jgi:hypothetical protein
MHDHGELAGEHHLCLLHAGAFGKPRVGALQGRTRRIAIVAMARKLLIAIWCSAAESCSVH